MVKTKWQKWREAIKDPPPERTAKIAANGYLLNMLGVLVTCGFLIKFNLWYVIFAFIFSTVSNYTGYKREMKQYNLIVESKKAYGLIKDEIDDDPSPTRRKFKTIDKYLGKWVKFVNILALMVLAYFTTSFGKTGFWINLGWVALIFVVHIFVYVNFIYPIARWRKNKCQKTK